MKKGLSLVLVLCMVLGVFASVPAVLAEDGTIYTIATSVRTDMPAFEIIGNKSERGFENLRRDVVEDTVYVEGECMLISYCSQAWLYRMPDGATLESLRNGDSDELQTYLLSGHSILHNKQALETGTYILAVVDDDREIRYCRIVVGNKPEYINLTSEKADSTKYKKIQFKDLTEDSDKVVINSLGYIGLFNGNEKGEFNERSCITRAEAATLICRMLGYEDAAIKYTGRSPFNDVPNTHWASGYIFVASQLGIVNGMGDGNFAPDDLLTYEQALKMLVCALGYDDINVATRYGGITENGKLKYPEAYINVAIQIGLTKHVTKNEPGWRYLVADAMYKALSIEPVKVKENGNIVEITCEEPVIKSIYGFESVEELLKMVGGEETVEAPTKPSDGGKDVAKKPTKPSGDNLQTRNNAIYKLVPFIEPVEAFQILGKSKSEKLDVTDKTIYVDNDCILKLINEHSWIGIYQVEDGTTMQEFLEMFWDEDNSEDAIKLTYTLGGNYGKPAKTEINLKSGTYIVEFELGGNSVCTRLVIEGDEEAIEEPGEEASEEVNTTYDALYFLSKPIMQDNMAYDMINRTYAELKAKYGKVKRAFYWDSTFYQFDEKGPWISFANNISAADMFCPKDGSFIYSNETGFIEPELLAVCTRVHWDLNSMITSDKDEYTLNEIESALKLSFHDEGYDDMTGAKTYGAEHPWCDVLIATYNESTIEGNAEIILTSNWTYKDGIRGGIPSATDGKDLKEVRGMYYNNDTIYKADKNISGEVVIPEGIRRIASEAFRECENITSVKLPKSLQLIGNAAFKDCINLEHVNIPCNVRQIGVLAFENCDKLTAVVIPASIKEAYNAFSDCDKLETAICLSLGDKPLMHQIFSGCPIDNLILGPAIDVLPMNAFPCSSEDSYLENLYIFTEGLKGVNGSMYGAAIYAARNVYYRGDEELLFENFKKLKIPQGVSFDKENTEDDYDGYRCEYLKHLIEGAGNHNLLVNSVPVICDVPMRIVDNKLMVHLESFCRAFDYEIIQKSDDGKTIVYKTIYTTVGMGEGNSKILINNKQYDIGVAPIMIDGELMFSVQDYMHFLGGEIITDNTKNETIIIYKEPISLSSLCESTYVNVSDIGLIKNIDAYSDGISLSNYGEDITEYYVAFDYYNYLHIPVEIVVYDKHYRVCDTYVTDSVWKSEGFVPVIKESAKGAEYMYDVFLSDNAQDADYVLPFGAHAERSFSGENRIVAPKDGFIEVQYPQINSTAYIASLVTMALRSIDCATSAVESDFTSDDIKMILHNVDWESLVKALANDADRYFVKKIKDSVFKELSNPIENEAFMSAVEEILTNINVTELLKLCYDNLDDIAKASLEGTFEKLIGYVAENAIPGISTLIKYVKFKTAASQIQLMAKQLNTAIHNEPTVLKIKCW